MNDPILLQTKLHRPRLPRDLLPRPRLLEQLDRGIIGRFTLVSAAAGFGKSTLVCSWIEDLISGRRKDVTPLPAIWLSLNSSDSELVVFLHYFIAAVRLLHPDACAGTLKLIQSPQIPPLEIINTTLINEIDCLPFDFILVLDDFHLIQGEAVHNLINELLHCSPKPLHLVIISRINPPFYLSSLRVKHQITEIRSRDLRFSNEEIDAYLQLTLPEPLRAATTEILRDRSEGWVAGLQLAAMSLRTAENVDAVLTRLSDADTDITYYLVDEVLSQQPEAIQKFLINTSILDHFWAELCESVIEDHTPGFSVDECLRWIESANLFVISLENQQGYYRYHHLFREMLKQRLLAEIGADNVKVLHLKAANWFVTHGLVEKAIHHALLADDLNLASQLMEDSMCDVLNREDRLIFGRWLRLLPEEYIERRPGLLMIKIWTLEFSWQLAAVLINIQRLEALLDITTQPTENSAAMHFAGDMQTIRGQILLLSAQAMYHANQMPQCIVASQQVLQILPESWKYVRGGAVLYLSLGMQAIGQFQEAEQFLLDQYKLQSDKTNSLSLRHLFSICFINFLAGNLEQTMQTAQEMLYQANCSKNTIMEGWAHFFLGRVYYQWNKLDLAQQHFQTMVDNRYFVTTQTLWEGMVGLAIIQAVHNQVGDAWQTLKMLSELDLERFGYETDETRSLRAYLRLLQGDLADACRWADAYITPPANQPLVWLQDPHMTKVRILLARGTQRDLQFSLEILGELYRIAENTKNVHKLVEIQAYRAVILDAQGKTCEAKDVLLRAIELSRSGAFVRCFYDLGGRMQTLLSELFKQNIFPEIIDHLLAGISDAKGRIDIFQVKSKSAQESAYPVYFNEPREHLTKREIEILTLMQEPQSAKEIAKMLSISPLTVKRHMINIYSKLGVNRRWDAITSARRQGILPP
jgi:LuxR family transcriptional regulator, maltose regulon positive regulatory protein